MKLLRHMKHNAVAYFALFVALGGTSYAAPQIAAMHHSAKTAKGGISCGGSCPATKVFWAYIGAHGQIQQQQLTPNVAAPAVYQTAVGGVGAQLVHKGLGDWLVFFQGQDLSNCARIATLVHDRGSASASSYDHLNPDPYAIHVLTTDATGNPADLDFMIMAFCGNSKGLQTSPYPSG
jgi:hypothetical protein